MPAPSRGHRRTSRDARRRALGQNFLHDDKAVEIVLRILDAPAGALVVDLGAGGGALTVAAARAGHRVLAVEVDAAWAARLRRATSGDPRVDVVHGDALAVTLPRQPYLVMSSAPFGVGTQIVRRVLAEAHGLTAAVVVLQHETALRLAGRPSSGRFAATWAPWFHMRVCGRIPREAFRPVPGVDAGVLRIVPRTHPLLSPAGFAAYAAFLERIFAGRAPTLVERVAAEAGGRRSARAALTAAGIPPDATPSTVAPPRYAQLFLASRPGRHHVAHVRRAGGRDLAR